MCFDVMFQTPTDVHRGGRPHKSMRGRMGQSAKCCGDYLSLTAPLAPSDPLASNLPAPPPAPSLDQASRKTPVKAADCAVNSCLASLCEGIMCDRAEPVRRPARHDASRDMGPEGDAKSNRDADTVKGVGPVAKATGRRRASGQQGCQTPLVGNERHVLTRYEKTRVISARAHSIALGAAVMVPCDGCTDALELAEREFKAQKLGDIIVRKQYPDGSTVDFRVGQLVDVGD